MAWVAIGITLAAFAYSLYMQSKIGSVKQVTQKFDGPTAEEGIAIPVVLGSGNIKNANVTGLFDRFIGGDPIQYSCALQLGLCHGKIDAFLDMNYGGKSCLVPASSLGLGVDVTGYYNNWFDSTPDTSLLPKPGVYGTVHLYPGAANLSSVDAGVSDALASKMGLPNGIGPRYNGVATAHITQIGLGTSPNMGPLSFAVKRIHTRHGGTEVQWYDAKAEISTGMRSREDVWKYKAFAPQPLGSPPDIGPAYISYDDSLWPSGPGGFSNAPNGVVMSTKIENYTTVPRCLTVLPNDGVLVKGDYPNYTIAEGMTIWLRWDMGPMLKFDTPVQCWHDDSARLWVNGNEVTLTPSNIDLEKEHFTSTAVIPAAYIDEDGPNIIAYRVQDSYAADGVTKIGTARLIYAGIQVGAAVGSELPAGVGNMNFAHMVHEVLTDKVWGMGYNDADLDDTAFRAAADTLYAEGLGGSFVWSQQMTIEDFLTDIMRHISGSLYIARDTGLFTLKLIRADYTVGDLLVLDESNISEIEEADRKQPGELVNCVTVTYASNLRGDQGTTAPLFDDGLVDIQGGVVSAQVDYPAITSPVNAAKLALRDLRILSAPILNVKLVADRAAANLHPGQPFVLNWPTLGLINFVMRVSEIDVGNGLDGKVKITSLEDVFFFPSQVMVVPNDPVGISPIAVPTPTVDVDSYRTALTVDTRNRGMVETAFNDAGWSSGSLLGNFTETEPGVMVRNSLGALTALMFDDVDPFTGVVGGGSYETGEQWMVGRTVFAFARAGDSSGGKKFQGAWIVDDIGGHFVDYGLPTQAWVATYARMHRAPGFNSSADFVKDMVVQVRAGTVYGGHFLQLDTAGVVLGTTEQAWSDEGTTFTWTDTYDLLRDDQLAGRQVSPDSFLVVSITATGGDLQAFATLTLGASRIPAGRWSATPQGYTLSGGDVGATTTLGLKFYRSGSASAPVTLFEMQTAALEDGFHQLGEAMTYQAPDYPMAPADKIELIPTLHTTSATPVTLSLLFSAANAITVQIPRAITAGLLPTSEEWFDVWIVDGVISDFSDHRHLRVHGAGPLVGIDTSTATGGTPLTLSFVDACTITAAGTPTSGAQIKTKKIGGVYEDMYPEADDIIQLSLMTDSGSLKFWQFAGGSA